MVRLEQLGAVGALEGGGVCRLALSDADREGRDLVRGWMEELGLRISIDAVGNVIGVRPDKRGGVTAPVLVGSHLDTVATGGIYDGSLGVLAGLEVIEALGEAARETERPVAVGFFTNEEGARFTPDMLGSGVHQGALDLETCLAARDRDGLCLGDELQRIGYAGDQPCGGWRASSYLELHIEQGPVLEREKQLIGAVTGVQGISWTEWTLEGTSNHAGTTPMSMRCDSGVVAALVLAFVRRLALDMGGSQVATVGALSFVPNLVNVIPKQVTMTVDLRNTSEASLAEAEARTAAFIAECAQAEGVRVRSRSLARFAPVEFDPSLVQAVEQAAGRLGFSSRRLPSGAGHDAQMFAPNCQSAMIFIPSAGGLSHNTEEFSSPAEIEAGARVLLSVVLGLAG